MGIVVEFCWCVDWFKVFIVNALHVWKPAISGVYLSILCRRGKWRSEGAVPFLLGYGVYPEAVQVWAGDWEERIENIIY